MNRLKQLALAALLLGLAGLLPAGPAAAAIVNYSIANPAANGWTGGSITVGSLDDTLPTLPSLITGIVNGTTWSFVPTLHAIIANELWIYSNPPYETVDFYSFDFGSMTSTLTTTWRDIVTTNGGTYANNHGGFVLYVGPVAEFYAEGDATGISVTFSEGLPVPVPAPFALLLVALPALWSQRRRTRVDHPA